MDGDRFNIDQASSDTLSRLIAKLASVPADEILATAYSDMLSAVYLVAYLEHVHPAQVGARIAELDIGAERWARFQTTIATLTDKLATLLRDGPGPEAQA